MVNFNFFIWKHTRIQHSHWRHECWVKVHFNAIGTFRFWYFKLYPTSTPSLTSRALGSRCMFSNYAAELRPEPPWAWGRSDWSRVRTARSFLPVQSDFIIWKIVYLLSYRQSLPLYRERESCLNVFDSFYHAVPPPPPPRHPASGR